MLSYEQEELISDAIRPLFQYLEREVIREIAQRIEKSLQYTRTIENRVEALQRLGYSPAKMRARVMKDLMADKEFQKLVEENTLEYKKECKKLLKEVQEKATKEAKEMMQQSGKLTWSDDISIWDAQGKTLKEDSFMKDLVNAISQQTAGEMKNLTNTTAVGFHTAGGYQKLSNAYKNELDKALIKICTGTYSKSEVVNEVIHNLAESGLRSIDYESGRSMQIDTAAKLAIRTGAHQISAKIHDENIMQSGENLVYVSKHWGARNKGTGVENHEEWQGKVYYIKPGEDYSEEAKRIGQSTIEDIWEKTGYSPDGSKPNNPLGLDGYNCRHMKTVWFLGASSKPVELTEPGPFVITGKTYTYYDMTQKMRQMERKVRALKRERDALKALNQPVEQINNRIKEKTDEYTDFCEKYNLKPHTANLRVEAGSSDIQKTKAYKDYQELAKRQESDKIELEEYKEMLKTRKIVTKSKDVRALPYESDHNSISDFVDEDGAVITRRVYDISGKAKVDYDTTDHNRPKYHPTGAHKHTYNYENKNPRSIAKKLSELDLQKNDDIIRKGENYHEAEVQRTD